MFNQQDLNAPFLMHKELGFGPRFVDRENRVAYPTLANLAIRRRAQFELLAEEMRVLYVALTRPKEKMILLGTVKDAAKKRSRGLRSRIVLNWHCQTICWLQDGVTWTGLGHP